MMERESLYQLIELPAEVVIRLQAVRQEVDLEQAAPYLDRLTERGTAAEAYKELGAFLAGEEVRGQEWKTDMKMLYCQLECAGRIFERYRQKGIEKTIYADTMKCFTRFLKECEQKNGRMFFDRGWWTYRQVSMGLFRIGTLEYEFDRHEGEDVIAVHIPSDADLSPEAVEHSLRKATDFFRMYYPEYSYDRYTCESWLMSPVLKQLLPGGSNIVSFQERFTIVSEDREGREFIEWLFQVPADTAYEELPERTSLQHRAKELLLAGGSVGSAFGIIRI